MISKGVVKAKVTCYVTNHRQLLAARAIGWYIESRMAGIAPKFHRADSMSDLTCYICRSALDPEYQGNLHGEKSLSKSAGLKTDSRPNWWTRLIGL